MGYLLVVLLALPLAGAVGCALLPNGRAAKAWALVVSLLAFGVSVVLGAAQYQGHVVRFDGWTVDGAGFRFTLASDAISFWLVLLTTVLQPLAIAGSFASVKEREKEYYAWMLALMAPMLGVFLARDVLLFYFCFELTIIPMFFLIGIWGGPDRRRAAAKFFLFTFAGSIFTLAAAFYLGIRAGSFAFADAIAFAQDGLSEPERFWVFLGFLAGFAVKVPLFPFHTWLPLAHTEAPTAGSVILAGVLLKLGTYGLLRLALPIGLVTASGAPAFPTLLSILAVCCVIGVVYGALVAWVQQDIKKLVAYSSVSHLGFCVLGMLALNEIGTQGSILYMINHGISTGAMFLVIGMIYDRFHTRDINHLSGLARRMPVMACFFVFFVLSSIGLPILNGFWSEFLTILGAFTSDHLGLPYGTIAATGIVLGAVYMLHMTARVIFGPLKFPAPHDNAPGDVDGGHASSADDVIAARSVSVHAGHHRAVASPVTTTTQVDRAPRADRELPRDLCFREIAILAPLALAAIALGVMPTLITRSTAVEARAIQTVVVVAPMHATTTITTTFAGHVPARRDARKAGTGTSVPVNPTRDETRASHAPVPLATSAVPQENLRRIE